MKIGKKTGHKSPILLNAGKFRTATLSDFAVS
jgi:hypothetical protein